VLDRYLERPAPDTLLVLVALAGAKADAALGRAGTSVEFAPLTGDRVPKWIIHRARTEHGAVITDEATRLLHEAVGSDLSTLSAELDKLASYTSGGTITEDAVGAVVGVRRGETLADLLDAVAARNTSVALPLVAHVLEQPKISAVQVVMALATQMLALSWGQAMLERGASRATLASQFYDLLKEGGAYPGRSWGDAVTCWTRYVDRWTPGQLDASLELLLNADIALKETRISSEDQVLASVVLGLCGAAGRG